MGHVHRKIDDVVSFLIVGRADDILWSKMSAVPLVLAAASPAYAAGDADLRAHAPRAGEREERGRLGSVMSEEREVSEERVSDDDISPSSPIRQECGRVHMFISF